MLAFQKLPAYKDSNFNETGFHQRDLLENLK